MSLTRREALTASVGVITGTGIMGTAVADNHLTYPDEPVEFGDEWDLNTGRGSNHFFEWAKIEGWDERIASRVSDSLGYETRPLGYFAANVNRVREPDTGQGSGCIDLLMFSYCNSRLIPDLGFLSNDKTDQVNEIAPEIFEKFLSVNYKPSFEKDGGIDGIGIGDDTEYSQPKMSVEETWTYTFEKPDSLFQDNFGYRGFLALQTPDDGRSYLVVGATFPDENSVSGVEFEPNARQKDALRWMRETKL